MQDRNVYDATASAPPTCRDSWQSGWTATRKKPSWYGLLHDLGKLVILKAAYDVRRQAGVAVPPDVLDAVMREMHPYVGAVVLRRWRLPSMLDEPIVCRHDWRSATVAPREAAITYFANRLSHRYSFGCEPETGALLGGAACAS